MTATIGCEVGGRYVLVEQLGEGAMGQVFRARHVHLQKDFALKLIAPAHSLDDEARARFNQEAQLASRISHPNIVGVTDFGEDPVLGAFMVMEVVDGISLVDEASRTLPLRRACEILGQIADALHYVHEHGIIHGDIKADNVMLSHLLDAGELAPTGRRVARLVDFGLAKHVTSDAEDRVSGSPHYIAPERAAGSAASVASDVYALGVLGYLLFTGTLPFHGTVLEILTAHIEQPVVPPSERAHIDPAFDRLILRAMAKDPAQRHASAALFRLELDTILEMTETRRRSARGSTSPAQPREMTLATAFDGSRFPQALVSVDGRIVYANRALTKLLGNVGPLEGLDLVETPLHRLVPGIVRAVRTVHANGTPSQRLARVFRGDGQAPLQMTLWLAPLAIPGCEIHVLIRVDEDHA